MPSKTEQPEMSLLHVALIEPQIPPNTGNIARLCAANHLTLHLVGTLGFRIDDRSLRRAGLDYWPHVDLRLEKDLQELESSLRGSRFFYFSAKAGRFYTDVRYCSGDCLIFGSESRGLSEDLLAEKRECSLRIPLRSSSVRSLNLATAVGIAVYEALRQLGFPPVV